MLPVDWLHAWKHETIINSPATALFPLHAGEMGLGRAPTLRSEGPIT